MLRIVISGVLALQVAAGLASPCVAVGDATVALGGGAAIGVAGTQCTLTTIGHDKNGDLVGLTAGRCGDPGAPVVANIAQDRGPVGTVTAADGNYYAVIKFDPAKVIPIPNYGDFAINGISPGPNPGQMVCKDGGATGPECVALNPSGELTSARPITRLHVTSYQPGDDGGPVTSDGLLIGVIYTGLIAVPSRFPSKSQIRVHYISAIFDDLSAKGGSGAGFVPIPG